jgi:uncharacterized protein (DUF1330 family)
MAKGYWIARATVNDPDAFKNYAEANQAAFGKYRGRYLVRGGKHQVMTGEGRERNVVIEFEDFDTAVACYNSSEYQHALAMRGETNQVDLVIVEGYDGPQPS